MIDKFTDITDDPADDIFEHSFTLKNLSEQEQFYKLLEYEVEFLITTILNYASEHSRKEILDINDVYSAIFQQIPEIGNIGYLAILLGFFDLKKNKIYIKINSTNVDPYIAEKFPNSEIDRINKQFPRQKTIPFETHDLIRKYLSLPKLLEIWDEDKGENEVMNIIVSYGKMGKLMLDEYNGDRDKIPEYLIFELLNTANDLSKSKEVRPIDIIRAIDNNTDFSQFLPNLVFGEYE